MSYTMTCCNKDPVWVENVPGKGYFYCQDCKQEVITQVDENSTLRFAHYRAEFASAEQQQYLEYAEAELEKAFDNMMKENSGTYAELFVTEPYISTLDGTVKLAIRHSERSEEELDEDEQEKQLAFEEFFFGLPTSEEPKD